MFITRISVVNVVMLGTRHSTADWVYFKPLNLLSILRDSKSTSGGVLCLFGSQTFVPVSSVSTESEII